MIRWLPLVFTSFGLVTSARSADEKPAPVIDYKAAPHLYWEREPQDVFSALLKKIANGAVKLDTSDEHSLTRSLLAALDVPVSSQLLVYSATSMQSERINARNPRALYFNEDVYVGVVPGGLIEVIGIDPELGGVYHVFNYPRPGVPPQVDRPQKCFNCHATNATQRLPGLIAESVAPLPNGKTLTGPASPLRPSDADTLNVTVAPALDIAFVWIWNGYERSGAPLSIMIESACSASTLPFLSVA